MQLHSLFVSHRQKYVRAENDYFMKQCREIRQQVAFPQQLTMKQKQTASKAAEKAEKAAKSARETQEKALVDSSQTSAAGSNAATTQYPNSSLPTNSSTTTPLHKELKDKENPFHATPEFSVIYCETLTILAQEEIAPKKYAHILEV